MKLNIIISDDREEEIIIYAKQRNGLIDEIEQLNADYEQSLIGYSNSEGVRLSYNEIECLVIENGKLFALTADNKLLLKTRLYKIEKALPSGFVKINQSAIANISKIKKFDASISGTLRVIFKNGYCDYVSRRCLKNVKERLGL